MSVGSLLHLRPPVHHSPSHGGVYSSRGSRAEVIPAAPIAARPRAVLAVQGARTRASQRSRSPPSPPVWCVFRWLVVVRMGTAITYVPFAKMFIEQFVYWWAGPPSYFRAAHSGTQPPPPKPLHPGRLCPAAVPHPTPTRAAFCRVGVHQQT